MDIQKKIINTNYTKGRGGYSIKAVVIHIAQGYLAGGHSWFNNPQAQASAHYMIGKNGEIWQFVEESDMAWHAGIDVNNMEYWGTSERYIRTFGRINPNLFTIGIENEGFSGERWTEAQIRANVELIADIHMRYNLGYVTYPNTIFGHDDVNSRTRAGCPGIGIHITNDLIIPANRLIAAKIKENEEKEIVHYNEDSEQGKETVKKFEQTEEKNEKKVTNPLIFSVLRCILYIWKKITKKSSQKNE